MKVTAPEIRGHVVARGTNDPIAGVKVHFEGRDDIYVLTKKDGSFVLPRQSDLVLLKVFTPCPVIDYPTPRRRPGALTLQKNGWKTESIELLPYYRMLWSRPQSKGNAHWKSSPWEDPMIDIGDTHLSQSNS